MALLPTPNLDYTDKDHDSILLRVRSAIRSIFPTWSDERVANFGNLLLEAFSFGTDVLVFYLDALARETRIVTATQRKALIALGKLVSFEPLTAAAASTDVTFTLAAPPTGDVTFPAGFVVSTAEITNPIEFQLLADKTISSGSDPPTVTGSVENSKSVSESFVSNSTANQRFRLPRAGYIDATASVTADNGAYTEVDTFLYSTSTDRHYTLEVDENDFATITFPNGISGVIPVGSIVVDYDIGGGANGNVAAGEISVVRASVSDSFGNIVQVTVTNPSAATGGADRESNASIRQRAPEATRVLNRAIAREDFEIVAEGIAGVARALMLGPSDDPAVEEATGDLFIVPEGGGTPSTALLDSVEAMFVGTNAQYPHHLGFVLNVLPPNYLTVDVRAKVFRTSNTTTAQVKSDVESALEAFFAIRDANGAKNEEIDFGFNYKDADGNPAGELPLSDIKNVVRDLSSVRKLGDLESDFLVNGEHRDVVMEMKQFPALGTVTVIDGDTGNTL